jgi:uncharacterized protein YndB with AHSA1/START domain
VEITETVEIAAPPSRVFKLVEDPQSAKLWMRGLEEVRITHRPADGKVGTRFVHQIKEGRRRAEYRGEITAHERPGHVAVRIGNERFAFDIDYRLAEAAGGTRLDYTARSTAATKGLAAAFFARLTRRLARKQLRRLKEAAEKGSG